MKRGKQWAIGVGISILILVGVGFTVRAWVVPSVLAGQLRKQFHGPAKFSNWWLGQSAGVEGLSLREGPEGDSAEWLTAQRITTDLSLAGLLRGRFAPGRIVIESPKLHLHFDRKGNLLTKGPFGGGGASKSDLPDIVIKDAEVTVAQEGRPPMIIGGVSGELDRSDGGEKLDLKSDDPTWGQWSVDGRFQPDFKAGSVKLASGPGFKTSADLNARVPFIPPEVWANVVPTGPIDVSVSFKIDPADSQPIKIVTDLGLHEAVASLPSLGIVADHTSGKITIDEGLVRVEKLDGKTLEGSIGLAGTLDFRHPSPRFDLNLSLGKVDVAATPKAWQLEEAGATGRLTGTAHLMITLAPEGADLTGSTGEALIENATLQGFPIKALSLAMHAEGSDLQYDTKADKGTSWRFIDPRAILASSLVAFQGAEIAKPHEAPRFRLPKSVSTKIELEDVDLANLVVRLEGLTRIKVPVPLAGHLALKADATIPLGHLTDLQGYTIRGHATLTGASIDGVDIGRIAARFDLDKGVLKLDDLEGELVERPHGDAEHPPSPTPPLPLNVPLGAGTFRGRLHVALSPAGKLIAHFDAKDLPIGELFAPYLPHPTPVAGRLSATFDTQAEIARLGEARAWSANGRLDSRQISYQASALDAISTDFTLKEGRLELPDFLAKLAGQPLKAHLRLGLEGTREFSGNIDITNWAIASVLALVPGAPKPAPASGHVESHLTFGGTLSPFAVRSDGKVTVRGTTIESVPFGDVVASWMTVGDEIQIKEVQARPFSGRFDANATVPMVAGRPIRVHADFSKIDTALLSASLVNTSLKLDGVANGRITVTIPSDLNRLTADLMLTSPDLKVQGVPTGKMIATIRGQNGAMEYEATADGPEGKVRFKGNLPLAVRAQDRVANAELRALGFSLADIWRLLGVRGAPTHLLGRAAIDANVRAIVEPGLPLGLHGNVEVRDLRWGHTYPLGDFRGVLAKTPTMFRLDSIRGDLFGGAFSGVVWGETPPSGHLGVNFELQTERASLHKILAIAPALAKHLEGFGSLRLTGRMDETLRATADVTVAHARFNGFNLGELRIPTELTFHPANGNGVLHTRRWSAKIAGGRVQGSAVVKVGTDHSFVTDLSLTDIDVSTIARVESTSARPGSGKVNGRISIHGTDPAHPEKYRGRIELGLNDASIGEIPVIRELGRFLGSTQGGAFEAGDFQGTIANRQIVIDQFTLQGRVLQIHITGTVSFDGQLDLAVLVNTNQIIPQTGQALVGVIPGLRNVLGRSEEALLRVSNYFTNRLLKFRISGTIKSPNVALDPGAAVGQAATGFFAGALKLPLGLIK